MAGPRKSLDGKPDVRAAGGLIWRDSVVANSAGETADAVEVVVIHRPSQDDWSFPKGKLDRGESAEEAAVREVEEETGLVCQLDEEVAPARYIDAKGRLKEVRYWIMRVVAVKPWSPGEEVDRRVWWPMAEAATRLTYEHDRDLLADFVATLGRRGADG